MRPIELALGDRAGVRRRAVTGRRRSPGAIDCGSMYRAWADKRRMQITEIAGSGSGQGPADPDGQRLWRASHPVAGSRAARLRAVRGRGGPGHRARALAVVPLGDVPAAKERKLIVEALEQAPRTNAVVRRYREQPPLVRDAAGKWRTGRLDLVLAENSICFRPASDRPRRRLAPNRPVPSLIVPIRANPNP